MRVMTNERSRVYYLKETHSTQWESLPLFVQLSRIVIYELMIMTAKPNNVQEMLGSAL